MYLMRSSDRAFVGRSSASSDPGRRIRRAQLCSSAVSLRCAIDARVVQERGAPVANTAGSMASGSAGATPVTSSGSAFGGASAGAVGPVSSGDSGAGGDGADGLELTPSDGWLSGDDNQLGIQGAVFAFADAVSGVGLIEDFEGNRLCLRGTAARVDLLCTPVTPATDCYGQYFGAAIGLNLNQARNDDATGGDPMPFDASALLGFSFEVSGSAVPATLRFVVDSADAQFCNPAAKPVRLGSNTFLLRDLARECWAPGAGPTAESVSSRLLRLAWQVVTNPNSAVPFDFCVTNLRAVPRLPLSYDPGSCSSESLGPTEVPSCALTADDEHLSCRACLKSWCCQEWQTCYGTAPRSACGWGATEEASGQLDCILSCWHDHDQFAADAACASLCLNQCQGEPGVNADTQAALACAQGHCGAECL